MLDNPMILAQQILDDPFYFDRLLGRAVGAEDMEDSDDEL